MSRIIELPPDRPLLDDGSKVGGWWHESDGRIVCDLCPRDCNLKPGDRGFCFVRENRDGEMLLTTYGRSTGFCVDPIEKKPLNHFYPGTPVLSFGTAGCNLGCKFCQNWDISKSRETARLSERATPEAIAIAAQQLGCRSVAFTYNDPVIWAEYAIDTAQACHAMGVKTVAVTAGYITPLARKPFFDAIDAANVDLKAFTEEFYHKLTLSHLKPVLETLQWLHDETDVWLEITNLIIPDANDSPDEIRQMCDWVLQHVGDVVPIHFSAFHPDFRMTDRPETPRESLLMAYDVARQQGLKYVYVGNVHDQQHDSTYCHHCGEMVIERDWYELGRYFLRGNRCGKCGGEIPGHFDRLPGDWGRRRLPVDISNYLEPSGKREPAAQRHANPDSARSTQAKSAGPAGEPVLTDVQDEAVHQAACEFVAAAANRRSPQKSLTSFAGAEKAKIQGAFVTLKRQGKLRGCCGVLGGTFDIADAVKRSAQRTATDDIRLPPVSPTELRYLDLSVSLLHGFRPVEVRGKQRVSHVEIGRHGLQIRRGQNAGLLLPVVATEHGLDAAAFLRHVCLKAGLPTTAWHEDDTELTTFESHYFSGPFSASVLGEADDTPSALLDLEEIHRMATHCRANLCAHLRGATPSYYLTDCPDGMVNGIALRVAADGLSQPLQVAELSLRPPLPLQATAFQLTQNLADALSHSGLKADRIGEDSLTLTVLHDPAMHGNLADPDLRGVLPETRALMLKEDENVTWVYDPSLSTSDVVKQLTRNAQVRVPGVAHLFSMQAQTSARNNTRAGKRSECEEDTVRQPSVAGTFYPADADQLARQVDDLLTTSKPDESPQPWHAAMVPHAGLVYSGRIAAKVLQRIQLPETIIVIGPKHTRYGVNWAVTSHATWSIPGANIKADPQAARELADAIDHLQLDSAAHQFEHAIEVELPLIARLAPQSKVIGIAIGSATLEQCQQFAHQLAAFLRHQERPPLLLVSSDMNHFATDEENRRLDEMAIRAIETLDPAKVYETVASNSISMCGMRPAVIVMQTLSELGRLQRCERVAYATSADVSGDRSRVVGYAGMLFGT